LAKVLAGGVPSYGDLAVRMRTLVDEVKVSRRKLSAVAEQSHAWVDTVLSGASTDPGGVALARLCEEYGYNVRWLVTGLGPKFVDRVEDERWARERGEIRAVTADERAKRLLERPAPKRT
jgi:hypothetical protein